MGGVPGGNDDDAGTEGGEERGIGGVEPAVMIGNDFVYRAEGVGDGCFEILPSGRAVAGNADKVSAGVVVKRSVADEDGGAEVVFVGAIFDR